MSETTGTGSLPLSPPTGATDLPVGSSGVTVEHVDRKLRMYRVTEEELFTLRGIGPTITLAFFGMMIGASVSLYTTLQGSTLSKATRRDLDVMYVYSRWLSVFFAVIALVSYARLWRTVRGIKQRKAATS